MFRLRPFSVILLSLFVFFVSSVGAQDAAPTNERDALIAEHQRRRQKLEQQLDDARQKVAAYEDGELDMPESTYMRYAQRVTMYMQKLERMKALDEEEIVSLFGDSVDL